DVLAGEGLIEPAEPLQLSPPIVGTAVHRSIPPFARARMHRRAADLLVAQGAPVDQVAGHLLLARPQADARAAELLREAASLAQARGEHHAAVALLERALAEQPPPAVRAAVLVDLAGADVRAGSAGAAARLEEALALLDDPEDQA